MRLPLGSIVPTQSESDTVSIIRSQSITLGVVLTDEILRNGVRHKVTTSIVTNNAVLPQNIFIKDDAAAVHDDVADSVASNANTLHTNAPLTTTKSHIQDNIQALKNLALSDNWQNIATDKFSENIQSLGASRSIEDNKLYLEKKIDQKQPTAVFPNHH